MFNIKGLEAMSKALGEVVKDHVSKAFDVLSARVDHVEELLKSIPAGERGEKGLTGDKGEDGKDGKDGLNGKDGEKGAQGERGETGEKGEKGDKGDRGEDGKSVTIDDISPMLESALSKWALEFERRAQDTLQKAIDKIPAPKDGKDGKDGRDGLGFEDISVEYDGVKTVTFKLQKDEVTKEFDLKLPVVVDRGIFKEGQTYEPGDGVTWGGSFWIAQKETSAKPDTPDSGFRLAVKRGRDGKDGRDGIDKTLPVKL